MTEIFDKNNPSKIDSVDLSINDETAISVNHMVQCNNLSAIYDVISIYVNNCYGYAKTLRTWYNLYKPAPKEEEDNRDKTN